MFDNRPIQSNIKGNNNIRVLYSQMQIICRVARHITRRLDRKQIVR